MAILIRILVIASSLLLAGCSVTEASSNRAMVSQVTGEIQAVATRADRRISFVDENWMWGEDRERENAAYRMRMASTPNPADQYMFEQYRAHHYCAEPSPDITLDLISRLSTGAGNERLSLSAELDTAAAAQPLFRRSQGVALFRDGLFALCQAHHNGAVGSEDYGQFIESLIERTSYLVALELALAPTNRVAGYADTRTTPEIADLALAEIIRSALNHLAPGGRGRHQSKGLMARSGLKGAELSPSELESELKFGLK